jgi:hypothetical protein
MAYRAVDNKYLSGYPPGQIEVTIYSKDADTLSGWVTKHSAPPTSLDPNRYWTVATNQTPVTVGGRAGLSFDWVPITFGTTPVHATAFFVRATYVLLLKWWSADPSYAPTLQQYYTSMLNDLRT